MAKALEIKTKAINNVIISGLNTKNISNYRIFRKTEKELVTFRAPPCKLKILPIELQGISIKLTYDSVCNQKE